MCVWCKDERGRKQSPTKQRTPSSVTLSSDLPCLLFPPTTSHIPHHHQQHQHQHHHHHHHHHHHQLGRHLMERSLLQRLAVPGVLNLVAVLAYSSQWLFHRIEPGPLPAGQACVFNALVACIFLCYWRTCFTDPGRIPPNWHDTILEAGSEAQQAASKAAAQSNRWCRRCEAYKPPRAHHCKTCQRCIMKMDHHCVWTVCLAFARK